jgi:hypothetical protein
MRRYFALGTVGFCLAAYGGTEAASQEQAVPATITLVAAGDIADCGSNGTQFPQAALTADLVKPTDRVVLTLGDNTYPFGAPGEFADCFNRTWGQFRDRIHPSPGNHDYMTTDADGYFDYFGEAAGPGRRGYYSFDVGSWHVISLNSNVDADVASPQYAWLLGDLAASVGALCTLVYWHHPVFTSGPHGNDPHMSAIYDLLHTTGADVLLVGHDHVYERFAPQDARGQPDPVRGIRSFTVGTGGARLYSFRAPQPNSEVRDASTYGVLRLTLGETGYQWAFIPVGGGVARDEGQAQCHR